MLRREGVSGGGEKIRGGRRVEGRTETRRSPKTTTWEGGGGREAEEEGRVTE